MVRLITMTTVHSGLLEPNYAGLRHATTDLDIHHFVQSGSVSGHDLQSQTLISATSLTLVAVLN